MKISYNWLKSYLDLEHSPEALAELLTSIGLEVAGIETFESLKGGLKGVVTGRVIACEPHPNSDHLSITKVDVGLCELLPIVCGAPNVAAGQSVMVATVGTILLNQDKEFTIKKAKIRGEVSEGMICSEVELGVGSDEAGIMVLPDDTRPGIAAADYFQIETDYIIEVDITPNRIDGASHLGVARDVAAALKLPKENSFRKPSVDNFKVDNHQLNIEVEVLNPEACPRYSGITISGVTVADSPTWLQNRLRSIGLTPINNIVDITNFVLFETGQPLHAFDASAITGNKVVVRTVQSGTKFVTLDSAERTLRENDLMICNAETPMCIGGVFGGLTSGVRLSTKNIFLESACFDSVFIRKTSRLHGLYTDASFRFERGTDINGTCYALKRAAMLIKEIAGGVISSEIKDFYPQPVDGFKVDVSYHNINRLIGKTIPADELKSILGSLEIEILDETSRGLSLLVPTYRIDVRREVDVIEEVLRIYGYNNIEIPTHINASLSYGKYPDPHAMRNVAADLLVAQGFFEMWSNSLTKASYYEYLTEFPGNRSVKLFNPLSNDLNGMRQTLLFGGLEAIQLNSNRRNQDLKLFEFGNTYHSKGIHSKEDPASAYFEEEHLSLFITGKRQQRNWNTAPGESSFYQLKSYAEMVMRRMGFDPGELTCTPTEGEIIAEGLSYCLGNGSSLLKLGRVSTNLTQRFDIEQEVFFADFDWGLLMWEMKNNRVKFRELPRYPEVRRDLALVLQKEVNFDTLKKIALNAERQLLVSVDLFDVYEGKGVPEGKKSYAMSFILRDDQKTLTDKQIDKSMEKILSAFKREVAAELR